MERMYELVDEDGRLGIMGLSSLLEGISVGEVILIRIDRFL